MSTDLSNDFSEKDAEEISNTIREAIVLLDKSVGMAMQNYDEEAVLPFKRRMAEVIADLSLHVLEQGFYQKYPGIRPYEL